jgi:serine/threonine protein kinase
MNRKSTAADFLARLRTLALLPADHLATLEAGLRLSKINLNELAQLLLQRQWLTRYQIQTLVQGEDRDLVLGPYLLLERIGQGGMGQVFKVRHRTLGRIAALKRLRPDYLDSTAACRRFQREVRAAAQLNHPNIVLAYDADEVDGTHFLVMEWIDGVDLARYLRQKGPLPIDLACSCIKQTALALDHAHSRGLVHRDVKPHNLLLAADGSVKLLDLGVARLSDGDQGATAQGTMTHTNQVLGTVDYIAPEQAANARNVDARADLYSLGCTFYHLLTGKAPFADAPDAMSKLIKHRLEEPPSIESLRADVPAYLVALVRKLMAKEPEERCQNAKEVVAVLDGRSRILPRVKPPPLILVTTPVVEPANPFVEMTKMDFEDSVQDTPQPKPRRSAWGLLLLLILVAVAGLIAWLSWSKIKPEAAMSKPPAPVLVEFPVENLLAKLNPAKHAVEGAWTSKKGTLISPEGSFARLRIPYVPPEEYRLTAVVERRKGNNSLNLGLRVGDFATVAMLHGWEPNTISGLECIEGRTAPDNPTRYEKPCLPAGKRIRVECFVTPKRVEVRVEDVVIIRWEGDAKLLSRPEGWRLPPGHDLFVGTYNSSFVIRSLDIKPLSGPGHWLE